MSSLKFGKSGQAMLLTVMAMGGTLLGAATIAGLLMLYQIRQASDLKDSSKAIFAADAGLELANYLLFFKDTPIPATPIFLADQNGVLNDAKIDKIVCFSDFIGQTEVPCENTTAGVAPKLVRSYGQAGRANRAFQQ